MKFVPKHYLLSNPVFWDPIFIEWDYTESILLTAYDLLRNDSIIYDLHSKSMTLKELMRENGFPKKTKIFADTGIFMLEWLNSIRENHLIKTIPKSLYQLMMFLKDMN